MLEHTKMELRTSLEGEYEVPSEKDCEGGKVENIIPSVTCSQIDGRDCSGL